MDIDLSGLLVFRHLAATGSFTVTGKRWKIPQPTVSLMIAKLEAAVGLVLLERSSTGTRLTFAGQQFLTSTNEVCESYLTFIDNMGSIGRRLDHEVLVAIDQSWFGNRVKKQLSSRQPSEGPAIRVCEITPNWTEALASSQYDVVLTGRFLRAGLSPEIQEAVIRHERGITVAWNPDFYPFHAINFSFPEVLRSTILLPDRHVVTGFGSFLLMWCDYAYGIQPANTIRFQCEREAAAAALAGLGVLLGPGDVMSRLAEEGDGLTHVRTFEFLLPEAFTYGVYCRSDEESKEVMLAAAAVGKLAKKLFA
jgi:DNA-binding transcriptional LysR family regulator